MFTVAVMDRNKATISMRIPAPTLLPINFKPLIQPLNTKRKMERKKNRNKVGPFLSIP